MAESQSSPTPPIEALHFPDLTGASGRGTAGDFNFLSGSWRIANHRLTPGATSWDAFDGEATCWSILDGAVSVEELRIPARNFAGMGLRLLDKQTGFWSDHWVNATGCALTLPGAVGGFSDGRGVFLSDYQTETEALKVMGVWDQIASASCRWRQAVSRDGGATWTANWIMHWRRA